MFHNISNPKWFGNWSRLEDDYLGNGGTDIADNFTFSMTSRLIDFKYLREAEAPAYTHGVPNDTFDYEFDDDDDDIPAFSFPEA